MTSDEAVATLQSIMVTAGQLQVYVSALDQEEMELLRQMDQDLNDLLDLLEEEY